MYIDFIQVYRLYPDKAPQTYEVCAPPLPSPPPPPATIRMPVKLDFEELYLR